MPLGGLFACKQEQACIPRNDSSACYSPGREEWCELVLDVAPRGLLQTALNAGKAALEGPARVGPDQTDGFPDMAENC